MEMILLVLIVSAVNVWCFTLGAKVAQTVMQGGKVETPKVDPLKSYREHKEQKAMDEQRSKLESIMRNIDNYDGTPFGQEDIPGGG